MTRRDLTPWLLAALGGTIALAFTQRKTIMLFGRKAIATANEGIFALQLPAYARPYAPIILRVSREEGIDPFLLFALGDRESGWGRFLSPAGPGGTGDNNRGHGLMQIDIGSFASWIQSNPWWDPYTNVKKGAQVLNGKLRFFEGRSKVSGYTDGTNVFIDKSAAKLGVAPGNYPDPRPLSGSKLWGAAIAAYNTGEANVLMAIAAGKSPEITTDGGDYLSDVTRRASEVAQKYDRATV